MSVGHEALPKCVPKPTTKLKYSRCILQTTPKETPPVDALTNPTNQVKQLPVGLLQNHLHLNVTLPRK